MKDLPEIPMARREYTPASKPKPEQYANRQRFIIALALVLGVGTGGLGYFLFQANKPSPQVATPTTATNRPTEDPTVDAPGGLLAHRPYEVAPKDELVVVSRSNGKVIYLRAAAAAAFRKMVVAAQKDGISLVPISGFRDLKYQENLFNRNVARLGGVLQARKVSAPPGYSEHHTGYAMDLADGKAPSTLLSPRFENTATFKWLKTNGSRFGFELSFDRGNDQEVNYEPWHWRFVGDKDSLETFYNNPSVPINPDSQG